MTTSRVARNSASSTECVMKKTIFWVWPHTRSRISCTCSRVSASSAPRGSSISSSSGSLASARAMPTRCCMPPEISHIDRSPLPAKPTSASLSSAARARSAALTPRRRSGSATLSRTFSQGMSACFWNTTPRSGPGPWMGAPSSSSSPSEAGKKPAMQFSNVVLPQPEAPSATMKSSPCSRRFTSDSAHWLPPATAKRTVRWRTSSVAMRPQLPWALRTYCVLT